MLHQDFPDTIDTVKELETPCLSSGPLLNHFSRLSQEDVDNVLATVKPTTCLLDPSLSWLAKAYRNGIWASLRDIINLPFSSGTFPVAEKGSSLTALKESNIRPCSPGQLCQCSNLAFLSKVAERVVAEQLAGFLGWCIHPWPIVFWFLPWPQDNDGANHPHGWSLEAYELRQVGIATIITPLTVVSDTVSYDFMTHCLTDVGVQGTALHWLSSCLHNQGQREVVGRRISLWYPLECGVPQGVTLYPMVFNIYTLYVCPLAQLGQGIGRGYPQYADDTHLYPLQDGYPDSILVNLGRVLKAMARWLKESQLKLSPMKTEVLYLSQGGWTGNPALYLEKPTCKKAGIQIK